MEESVTFFGSTYFADLEEIDCVGKGDRDKISLFKNRLDYPFEYVYHDKSTDVFYHRHDLN